MNVEKSAEVAIQEVIATIYQACKEGREFDRLNPLFHKKAVMVQPGFTSRAKGRETCLQSYVLSQWSPGTRVRRDQVRAHHRAGVVS